MRKIIGNQAAKRKINRYTQYQNELLKNVQEIICSRMLP